MIEVLIALAVLSVGILAVIGVFPTYFKSSANNWRTTQMMMLAQQTMDDILESNVKVSVNPVTVDPPPPQIPRDTAGNPTGYVQYWGEPEPGGVLNDPVQVIKVKVYWVEHGRPKSYTLTSAIAP